MTTLNFITQLEANLKAAVSLIPDQLETRTWLLRVHLVYENQPAGEARFTLQGYSESEAREIALNMKSNSFLMREIDEFLWSDSD